MDLDLQGKSVIVTGGASNIGRAITLGFAAEGARVTIADLDTAAGERVAALALQDGAAAARVVRTDVTDLASVQALFQETNEAHGGIHCLVNNVGWDKLMFFTQTTPELWQKLIAINYLGVLNCTKTALDYLIPAGGGSIVSISSDASRQGEPREAVYGGLKAAVNSFMKTIAKENGRYNIRCNCVCPGVTVPDTVEETSENSMWKDKNAMFTDEQFAAIAKTLPLRRIGKPSDIANAVVFLSSAKAASFITGQVLSVSGGYSMIG
jgi:NAD(P)-dependent dehydrogenase (short-subunit alcohol dehydrogenase family)